MSALPDFLLARIAEDETVANIESDDFRLADSEAKRRIVLYSRVYAERDDPTLPGYNLARHVLWDLALPYADHPDYREEWKP